MEHLKNLLNGFGGVFDLSERSYQVPRHGFETDARNLSSDFRRVGDDLKKTLADEQANQPPRQK